MTDNQNNQANGGSWTSGFVQTVATYPQTGGYAYAYPPPQPASCPSCGRCRQCGGGGHQYPAWTPPYYYASTNTASANLSMENLMAALEAHGEKDV